MVIRLLDSIESPADLKTLTDDQLARLAHEIREQIIYTTSNNGGHIGPSLGVVELILACHAVMDCPTDKLVFDVGHQAYAHKLVTGRAKDFDTLRTFGGISGFPKPSESPYDVHPSGHASDSLSVALGCAMARDLRGSHEKVAAIIGDAALSGGMAFEALNHIGQTQTQMAVILNDNEMSISRSVGAMANYLGRMRASRAYTTRKDQLQERLESGGKASRGFLNISRGRKDSIKQFIIPDEMLFEQLGLVCTAPIDGHDIPALKSILSAVLDSDVPVLIHVVTKKGRGYGPAEKNPSIFHGISPFDIRTGKPLASNNAAPKYTNVFSDALVREAKDNEDVVAITAAMKDGTGLAKFSSEFPDRFIDVGIAEEHAVGLASGLAASGKLPVVALYSTFLQRAIDQMIIDNALPDLHVVFAIDRGGLVGDDGPTHHGVFDLVYTRMVPHMRVLAPSDEAELVSALHTALALDGPVALRYPRGAGRGVVLLSEPETFEPGVSRLVREGSDVALLAFGRMVQEAEGAADALEAAGLSVRVVDMRWVKPLDMEAVMSAARDCRLIVTLEEGVIQGGVGEAVIHEVIDHARDLARIPDLMTIGIPDEFVQQGKVPLLHHAIGIDAEGIARSVAERLSVTLA